MKNRSELLSVENALYLASLGVALALRLWQLGASPLAESEAREALIVFQWLRGLPPLGLPQSPAYFLVSALGFFVLGASDAAARLGPALAGASLVLLPKLFRDKLGRAEALLASALLAVSAGLWAAARTADGTLLALAALGWGVGLLRRYLAAPARPWLMASAALFGLGLACGAPFVSGATLGALATAAVAWRSPEDRQQLRAAWHAVQAHGVVFFATLGATAFLVATAGLAYFPGLGALADSWRDWLTGFAPTLAGRAPGTFLLFLLADEPLGVTFGLLGMVLAFRRPRDAGEPEAGAGFRRWLVWFALAALTFCLIYGTRAMPMVAWVAAPLAVLAASAIVELLRGMWTPEEWPQVAVQVALVLALFVFAALRLTNYVLEKGTLLPSPVSLNVSLAVLAILMALGITLLFGAGWSWRNAVFGAALSVALALFAVGVNAGWSLTQGQPDSAAELWWQQPTAAAVDRLVSTVKHVSNLRVGSDTDLPLTLQADTAGVSGWVLRWAFRNFTHVTFVSELGPQVTSVVVVAPATQDKPALGTAYVGQPFAFQQAWAPNSLMDATDWMAWLLYRRAPAQTDKLILWVQPAPGPASGQ
jgi:hypothetical protein